MPLCISYLPRCFDASYSGLIVFSELLQSELARISALWILLPFGILLLALSGVFYRAKEKRALTSLSLRAAALILLALAWADPIKKDSKSSQQLIGLVDLSSSISKNGMEVFISSLKNFSNSGDNLSISLFPFAKTISKNPVVLNGKFNTDEVIKELQANSLDRGDTDIGAALQFVSGAAPGSAVLLMSDGFETKGNAKDFARTFAASGGRIYPLIPGEEAFRSQELELSMLQLPLTSKANDLVEVRVTARNTTNKLSKGKLEIFVDDKQILNQKIEVDASDEKLILAKTPPLEGGLKKVVAKLTLDGGGTQELHRFVSVRNKARLILLSGSSDDERVLKQLLTLKGYTVDAITLDGRGQLPKNFDECSGLIFNNVGREQVNAGFLNQVKAFAEQGGGVLLVGGDKSFGLGGYIDTPIEEISPLKFVPPKTTKKRVIKAIALLIDKSRSMAFDGKIEGAREAALLTIQSLKDEDYATVIGFDSTAFVVIRMDTVSNIKPVASYRLNNLVAMGRTDLLPALVEARRALAKAPADRKHIIVLSDGKIPFAGDEYLQELQRLRQESISLSAVAVGDDADAPFMQMLSQYGKGAFYQTLNASKLPEIFLNDVKVATGERTMKERAEFPVGVGPSGVHSTSLERFPVVRGYVETLPKKDAAVELITKSDDAVSPLLASWKFGAGKVVAFTSDANGRWSLPWLSWEGFSRFWSDLIEQIEHAPDKNSSQVEFDLRTSVNRGSLNLDLSVFDEKLRTGAAPKITAEVILPSGISTGEKRIISFLPEKRGRFKSTLESARPGDFKVQIIYGNQKLPLIGLSLDGGLFGEAPGKGINRTSLSELAGISGGIINPKPEQVARSTKISETIKHLFPPLVVIAFLLLMIEIFLRELGFSAIIASLKNLIKSKNRSGPSQSKLGQSKLGKKSFHSKINYPEKI